MSSDYAYYKKYKKYKRKCRMMSGGDNPTNWEAYGIWYKAETERRQGELATAEQKYENIIPSASKEKKQANHDVTMARIKLGNLEIH